MAHGVWDRQPRSGGENGDWLRSAAEVPVPLFAAADAGPENGDRHPAAWPVPVRGLGGGREPVPVFLCLCPMRTLGALDFPLPRPIAKIERVAQSHLPGGETVSQQVLVLFFQVRILAG